MEEVDKGCPMIRMGVSGWVFFLVPAYPGSPGPKAVKWLCVCVLQVKWSKQDISVAPYTECNSLKHSVLHVLTGSHSFTFHSNVFRSDVEWAVLPLSITALSGAHFLSYIGQEAELAWVILEYQ